MRKGVGVDKRKAERRGRTKNTRRGRRGLEQEASAVEVLEILRPPKKSRRERAFISFLTGHKRRLLLSCGRHSHRSPVCKEWTDVLGQVLPEQGSANLFYKGPDSKYAIFSLMVCVVSVATTQPSLCSIKADLHRQHVTNRLGSTHLKLYLTGAQLDLALGLSLLTAV